MKQVLKLVFAALILSSCQSRKAEKAEVISLDGIDIKKLEKVDSSFRAKFLDQVPSIRELDSDYQAFFYRKFSVNGLNAVLVYVVRDSYGIVHLLLFDGNKKLISSSALAGGICAGPAQENSSVTWCEESFSTFTNETDYYKTVIKKRSNDFINSPLFVDTIKTYHSINEDGSVKLINTDSIRVEKYLDEQGKEK